MQRELSSGIFVVETPAPEPAPPPKRPEWTGKKYSGSIAAARQIEIGEKVILHVQGFDGAEGEVVDYEAGAFVFHYNVAAKIDRAILEIRGVKPDELEPVLNP